MDDKILDNIFKNTFSQKKSGQEDAWDEFELKLQKKMFYKFSWNRFNIYYMIINITCFLGTCFFLYQFLTPSERAEKNTAKTITTYSDTIHLSDTIVQTIDTKTGKPVSKAQKKTILDTKKQTIPADSAGTTHAVSPSKDTVVAMNSISENTNPVVTPAPVKVVLKKKKTVYLTHQRDTIIKLDTVKVKREKKR